MGVEIEAKFRLQDPAGLRERLIAAGARRLGAVLEENTYFDTPDEALRGSDRGLRLRTSQARGGKRQTLLTYKGPRQPGDLKIRQEQEVAVSSPEDAAAILEGLGYRPALSFQKRRESFELAGARIELDELPELGFFLEIEADDEQAVREVQAKLDLAGEPTLTSPYVALVAEHVAATPGRNAGGLSFRPPGGRARS